MNAVSYVPVVVACLTAIVSPLMLWWLNQKKTKADLLHEERLASAQRAIDAAKNEIGSDENVRKELWTETLRLRDENTRLRNDRFVIEQEKAELRVRVARLEGESQSASVWMGRCIALEKQNEELTRQVFASNRPLTPVPPKKP